MCYRFSTGGHFSKSFSTFFPDDLTEDPEHPKITWPSAENCPLCRAQPYGQVEAIPVQGELWNVRETAAYLIKVYRKENVVPNNVRITSELKG